MDYLILIYSDEKSEAFSTPEETAAWMGEYNAYTAEMASITKAGEALHPTSSATTVRIRDGQRTTTHGPFAETKEQLGGFYLISAANLDEAIEWAAKCPGARVGSIEVRPVIDYSQVQ
jgi:hypothetical protein